MTIAAFDYDIKQTVSLHSLGPAHAALRIGNRRDSTEQNFFNAPSAVYEGKRVHLHISYQMMRNAILLL